MTGLTRRQAAEALGALFGTQFRYLGGTYKAYEVPDREDKIWKIVYDSSIRATRQQGGRQSSVLSDEYKVEMNSPKLEYSEMEKLQGAVDDVRGIRYSGILKHLGNEAADKDNIGKTYYNGRPTIANKCKFIKENDYAGVMIWQLFQDAHNDNYDLKLINVVGREMME